MNNALEKIWKEAVVTLFQVLSRHLPGGTEKFHENLIQDNNCLARDLNPGPPEYEAGVLTTRLRRSDVMKCK
jgi:hypothetical protein